MLTLTLHAHGEAQILPAPALSRAPWTDERWKHRPGHHKPFRVAGAQCGLPRASCNTYSSSCRLMRTCSALAVTRTSTRRRVAAAPAPAGSAVHADALARCGVRRFRGRQVRQVVMGDQTQARLVPTTPKSASPSIVPAYSLRETYSSSLPMTRTAKSGRGFESAMLVQTREAHWL